MSVPVDSSRRGQRRRRLADLIGGIPRDMLSEDALQGLARWALDLDAFGRLDSGAEEPLVDEQILRSLLAGVGNETSEEIVGALLALPSHRLRRLDDRNFSREEVTWFELVDRVVVFDPEPADSPGALDLPAGASLEETMGTVNSRLPGLELELLDPTNLPERLRRAQGEGEWPGMLAEACRHLGWWAALAGALLAAPASIALGEAGEEGRREATAKAWPAAMHLMGLTVGDWTLTVVCGCLLAPVTAAARP
jgi:hypothetical protein